jgi:hypothetical protein
MLFFFHVYAIYTCMPPIQVHIPGLVTITITD